MPPLRSRQGTAAPIDTPRRSAKTTGGTSPVRVMSAVLRALRTDVMPKLASHRRRDSALAGWAGRPDLCELRQSARRRPLTALPVGYRQVPKLRMWARSIGGRGRSDVLLG